MISAFQITGIVALLFSLGTCMVSKGAVHEIGGLIWLLIAIVAFAAAGIIDALRKTPPRP